MRNNYWQRKRDLEKGVIKKISSENKIHFSYKGNYYYYIYKTTSNSGLAYIYTPGNSAENYDSDIIYGPYENQRTELGKEIYEELIKQKIIQNGR